MKIKLDLVNFEQAKALRELGFYCYCDNNRELYVTSNESTWEQEIEIPYSDRYEYVTHRETLPVEVIGQLLYDVQKKYSYKNKFQTVYAPTLELAAKWLREEKNIIIQPCAIDVDNYLLKVLVREYDSYEECYTLNNKVHELVHYDSWEESLSAGIDKATEILKNN